ncbi:MAG: apolipoprotein N-acyltransferase [Alphaproteobacteria bacterium]|nr:apolipoprotein N-acyltransferase [Alphaproteobacteria bacterium]MBU0803800.1 apolipoprotein N-acyltransferase [Alphaproteobacteria bacterium]MBU0872903.1 apolipoprotein N-acyltransferase [Alphaproteobacteria bacterium]MBU1402727.1 apolipoprotein N-acyltransferase [Alphaproteobacteria bacterium]MBU1593369.1 apolipoprotein N-acyltransferase [Alphaproteobacteria bacterium]
MERLAGRIILLWGWRRALVAFTAGALAVLTQAPFDFFAVGFVSFPVLVWLLDGATVPRPAALTRRLAPALSIGWWFGFGYFLAGLWWIGNALLVEADSFAWALPIAVVGIPALLAIFYAFACALAWLLWTNNISRIAALAFAFGLAEWLRTFLFTGFPWNPIGFAAMPTPLLMQSVKLVGVIGMNALAVFIFSMPALFAARRNLGLGVAAALALVAAHLGYGFLSMGARLPETAQTLPVRIVQPAVDLSEKWDNSVRDRIFATTLELSARPPEAGMPAPKLILWPETAVPFLFTDRPDALAAIGEMLQPGQLLLTGAVRAEPGSGTDAPRYYNAVIAIDDSGEIADAVDKVHLVPFGEYLPFSGLLARLGIEQLVAGPMNFVAGSQRHPLALPGGIVGLPFICYEIIFPDIVAVDVTSPGVIVNVTNDAWFGETPGPYQHFRQAQVRSVESGMPLLRAANTGISGVIDPRGRIVDGLAMNSRGILDVELAVPASARNSYPQARLVGFAILLILALFAAAGRVWHGMRAV